MINYNNPVGYCTLWLRRDSPFMILKYFECTAKHNKVLYKCLINSFINQNIDATLSYKEVYSEMINIVFQRHALWVQLYNNNDKLLFPQKRKDENIFCIRFNKST